MLEKLRRQFILIIMALVTAALAIMAGVIIFINYQQLSNDVMSAVEYATTAYAFEDRGGMHGGMAMQDAAAATGSGGETGDAGAASGSGAATGDAGAASGSGAATGDAAAAAESAGGTDASGSTASGAQREGMGVPPEAQLDGAYDSSFEGGGGMGFDGGFAGDMPQREARVQGADMVATSVYLVADGAVTATLMDALELEENVVQVSVSEVCTRYEQSGTADGSVSGHLDSQGLFYSIRQTPSGLKAAFASDAYVSNSIGNLGMVLGVVSLCVWIAFLLVSIVLARWVVRPTQRAWDQQQQFVADASHELKTPLAVMMANNSILLSHAGDTVESQRRWVESNQDEARQMLELVNDMLFLARPENAAERQKVLQDVDLSALVEGNVLQFEAVCFERGVQLTDDVAEGLVVSGDANRLQRLVSTLVDNACKYGDSKVHVSLQRDGNQAKLAITNDGATIPADDLPHVFDRFYRVDKARVRSEGGVGLGLAIAQEVAHEHGGAIAVTSSEAAGTTFTATLPLKA